VSDRAYAAVVQIVIDPDADPAHRHGILDQFVIPELRALPGYLKSLWLSDCVGIGTCIVVFDDAERARAGLEVLTREGGPTTLASGVHEVEGDDLAPVPS